MRTPVPPIRKVVVGGDAGTLAANRLRKCDADGGGDVLMTTGATARILTLQPTEPGP